MAQQILEGTWEEIAAHTGELAVNGKKMKLIVDAEANESVLPNYKMLAAMQAAEEIQKGMNPEMESDGVAILREGRRGAMYGNEYGSNPAD